MATTVSYSSKATTVEVLTTNTASHSSGSDVTVTHNSRDTVETYNAGSSPPVTTIAAFTTTMTAGTAAIDMTAMTGSNGATVDATGLKLQVAKFIAPTGNANVISVDVGTTNGYQFFGADFEIELQPGSECMFMGNDAAPDVAGATKVFDIAGTGAQTLNCVLVFG